MALFGRADEVVVGALQPLRPSSRSAARCGRASCARRQPLKRRGLLDLLPVLVGAGEEEHVVAVEPLEARNGVGRDGFVGVADMRRAVRVRDRGGDVIGLAGRVLFGGHEGRYQPRVASASKPKTPKTKGLRSRL